MPISRPFIKAQVQKFTNWIGITEFKASETWLGKFKQRHSINYDKLREKEHNALDDQLLAVVTIRMRVIAGSSLATSSKSKTFLVNATIDIFNGDEAGNFCRIKGAQKLQLSCSSNLRNSELTCFLANTSFTTNGSEYD